MRFVQQITFATALLAAVFASQAMGQGMRMSAEDRTKQLKDSLSLTTAQADSILKIFKDMDQKRQALFSSSDGDRQSRMESMRKLGDEADTKIEALLTTDQKAKYEVIKKERQARMEQYRRRQN